MAPLPSGLSRLLVLCIVAVVGLSACSSGSDDTVAAADTQGIELVDIATGDTTSLDAALAADGDKPVLAWFWAPHCPTCRGEAPELDAFMADNADEVSMVGIGTRDDYALAEDFLADTGVQHFPLLWEETGDGWATFDVTAQPYLILLDGDEVVERWPGGATPQEISDRLAELS